MKTLNHPRRLLAGLAAMALVVAACGDDDDAAPVADPDPPATAPADDDPNGDDPPADDPNGDDPPADDPAGECTTAFVGDNTVSSLSELDFSGLTVNVGSKDFVEQFVLGYLLIVGLEAGGASIVDNVNLGGTVVNRDALLSNEIDAYWEYNGTGWTVHLGQEDPSFDRETLTTDVCVMDLDENGIRWIGVSEFNNTYGFATAPDFLDDGQPFTLQSMADYMEDNPDSVMCLETEFPNRPDGLVLFEDATGFQVPDSQIEILETGVIYDETSSGNCDFGEIFTTDGRIPALGLNVVDDPGVFILYNVSLTVPDSVYQQAPEAFQAITETILAPLDNATMAELNRRVSADGEDPRDVAESFLRDEGLID